MNRKLLIVNADDYGYSPGVSAGIRKAHHKGVVTSTTAMMNMPHTIKELMVAQEECPKLRIGVHLVLTVGKPVNTCSGAEKLVGRDGTFPDISQYDDLVKILDPINVKDEWRTQIERLLALDLQPSHLDSHHHISYLYGKLFDIMISLAQEYNLAIRYPPMSITRDAKVISDIGDVCCLHPNQTITSFYDRGATLENLLHILNGIPFGTTELMCHPGILDKELTCGSSYTKTRERELGILSHISVWKSITGHNIQLATYDDL